MNAKRKATRSARCTNRGRTCLRIARGVKAALPVVPTPTRSLTPTHFVGKLWKQRKIPPVEKHGARAAKSGDAAGRRGVFPPKHLHTYTPLHLHHHHHHTATPVLPPGPEEPQPSDPPKNSPNIRTYLDREAQKSPITYLNPQSHARCPCCLSSSLFFFFVSSHQT